MVFTMELLWLFVAAMIIISIGFKNYVWFISLGYGFSIAGEGILMLILYGKQLTLGTIICFVLYINILAFVLVVTLQSVNSLVALTKRI